MNVSTFEKLQELFLHDMQELSQIHRRRWYIWPMARIVKEEHLGRCCYLAEEFLSPSDLCALKQKIGLSERQWRLYKVKVSGQ
ncbi:MAG: hypothetical protein H0V70_16385 [Ktedonobacteraceae bacterium]|nr:hypothetical protein [Ktedonobacteraceae bacterium]